MRSSRVLTLVAGVAWLAACGGDGGGPSNGPTAAFNDPICNQLACTFDGSTSTGTIASYAWDFGDPNSGGQNNTATTAQASHTFSAGGTFSVKLTVTDNGGNSNSATKSVTVDAGNPQAAFTVSCSALDCTVTDASTDAAPGSITAWHWDFGDGSGADVQAPPAHHYAVTQSTPFTITLTVTDNDGNTGTTTQSFNVSPAAGLTCNGQACTLDLTQKATVVVTLMSSDCQVHGDQLVITAPVQETVFDDGCYETAGTAVTLNGGAAFNPGTSLAAEVRSGFSGTANPQLQVTGDFTNGWTLKYDDGFVGPGEPDFNDLVVTVKATVVP